MSVLDRFREVTGYEAAHFYGACAFFVAIVLAYLLFATMKGSWIRLQAEEMKAGDVVNTIARAIILLMFFIWLMS
ncbi:hypothetical protein ACSV5M_21395 [Cellvibrio sp. ARAG 10.3]|uniref:hypothetical protein n=1 Tax=Cellvibrio sp. ARAG 10.3 TaxID=3451358 RepID=UPI003F47822D